MCSQVDVSAEEDRFQEVVTAGLTVLILGIETQLDRALQEMVKMPWATIESVRTARGCSPSASQLLKSCFRSKLLRCWFCWWHVPCSTVGWLVSGDVYQTLAGAAVLEE